MRIYPNHDTAVWSYTSGAQTNLLCQNSHEIRMHLQYATAAVLLHIYNKPRCTLYCINTRISHVIAPTIMTAPSWRTIFAKITYPPSSKNSLKTNKTFCSKEESSGQTKLPSPLLPGEYLSQLLRSSRVLHNKEVGAAGSTHFVEWSRQTSFESVCNMHNSNKP